MLTNRHSAAHSLRTPLGSPEFAPLPTSAFFISFPSPSSHNHSTLTQPAAPTSGVSWLRYASRYPNRVPCRGTLGSCQRTRAWLPFRMALTFSGGPKGTGGHGRGKLVPPPRSDPLPCSQKVGQVAKSRRVGNSCRPSMSGSSGRDLERGQWAEFRGQQLDKETKATWGKGVRGETQGGTNKAELSGIFLPRPSYLPPWSPQEASGSRAKGPGCWCRIPGCDMGCEEGAFPAEAGEGAQILAR